jgi:hypothetical protein
MEAGGIHQPPAVGLLEAQPRNLEGSGMAKEIREREARQGFWDRPVLYVLAGGLLLAGIYAIILFGWVNTESDADIANVPVVEEATPD